MKPQLFWMLSLVILLQGLTIRNLKNEVDNHWDKTLDNATELRELRKDLDQTIYALGSE